MSSNTITIKDYNIAINENQNKDMQEIILISQKGEYDFSVGMEYTLSEKDKTLSIKQANKTFILENFSTQLINLIQKEIARFVILEVKNDLMKSMRGDVFFPNLIRKKRLKTGGRVKKDNT